MRNFGLVLLAFGLLHTEVGAQYGWLGGVKGGITVPKLRAPSTERAKYSSGFESVVGPQFGVVAEFRFSALFSLQTELNYSSQGGQKNGKQRIITKDFKAYIPAGINLPDYLYSNFNNDISLVYIELPLMAKFSHKISPTYRLSIYGGPYVGMLIKAEANVDGTSKIFIDPEHKQELTYNGFAVGMVDFTRKEDIIDQLNKTNYGIQGASSIEYNARNMNYFLALGGTLGLKRLQKDPNFGDNKTGALTITVGLTRKL
jgi:hypothetical protein